MSYYGVPRSFYHELNAETPGWQLAPVPGWGINPLRAGPARVGVGLIAGDGGCVRPDLGAAGDQYDETTWGHVALASAGSLLLGMAFGFTFGRRSRPA